MKLIDSDALLKQLGISERFNNADIPAYVIGIIKSMPEAHRKGKWINKNGIINCSVCGQCSWSMSFGHLVKSFNFCPNCGARMVSEDDE